MEYSDLLKSKTGKLWEKIGIEKRSGAAVPLFYIYSRKSIGIGEIPDLRYMVDWCVKNDLSILQLLPMNEMGFGNSPYSSISTFALEPMYLSIHKIQITIKKGELSKIDLKLFKKEIASLRKRFPKSRERVDYRLKLAKLQLISDIFQHYKSNIFKSELLSKFIKDNKDWIHHYAAYKILKRKNAMQSFENWKTEDKNIGKLRLQRILEKNKSESYSYYWLQWQLFLQMKDLKKYANENGIFIMGDIPFLVSRDSADVWCSQNKGYFKLDKYSGAPPDMYFAMGQKWGMPPYDWSKIEENGFSYIMGRLKYAENFYDMFRIDHFVGLFRIWTIDKNSPPEKGGLEGEFDPVNEWDWESQGRKIISAMISSTRMMPCAEDLGTVPECSYRVLEEFGIVGINVQRWMKDWQGRFVDGSYYRVNSIAAVSTHDSSTLAGWWELEAGTIDRTFLRMLCSEKRFSQEKITLIENRLFDLKRSSSQRLFWNPEIESIHILPEILDINYDDAGPFIHLFQSTFEERNNFLQYIGLDDLIPKDRAGIKITGEVVKAAIEKIKCSRSIFNIQLLNEYLSVENDFLKGIDISSYRINYPGLVNESNWSLRMNERIENLLK
ncbi:hypothetical protein BH10BAC5_BH10BAC5_10490 [soil metagenome]